LAATRCPEGSRSHFGSLLVGYQSPNGLMFAGTVGTGFSEKLLATGVPYVPIRVWCRLQLNRDRKEPGGHAATASTCDDSGGDHRVYLPSSPLV
jgi:hypothetical protein